MRYSYKPECDFYELDVSVKDDRVVLRTTGEDGETPRVLVLTARDLNFFQYLIGKYNDVCCG